MWVLVDTTGDAEATPEEARKDPRLKRVVARTAPMVQSALWALVDLVLPPSCPGCRRLTGSAGGLCVECWSTVRFLEEPWCERLGTPFPYDLGHGAVSAPAIADPPAFDRARSAVAYEGIVPNLVHALKYGDRTELASMMGGWMTRAGRELLGDADALVPVPLHRRRLFGRRYNQAALLAGEIARRSAAAYRPMWLVRRRPTAQQVGLSREARADNVRNAFAVPDAARSAVKGARIIVIDDVLTTGATVEAVARTLRRAGAGRVDVLTFARVVAAG